MIDPSAALRQGVLGLSRSGAVRRVVERVPVSRSVVRRFVAGVDTDSAVDEVTRLVDSGRLAALHFLAAETRDVADAIATRNAYLEVLHALHECGLTTDGTAAVSVTLSSLGRSLPDDGDKIALDNARQLCEAAAHGGTTITVEMEDHTTTDSTLEIVRDLRADFPWVGVAVQANLRRTEADCRDLTSAGSRIRLCSGAFDGPDSVAYQTKHEIDLSYVRCLKVLLAGQAYPMIATHDARLLEIARSLADKELRAHDSFEFQMLLGVHPEVQLRLAGAGYRTRTYVPYGAEWYPYVMRRMTDRPTTTKLIQRSTKG